MTCSRCGSRFPSPSCFVCAEPEEPERDWFSDDKESQLQRLLDEVAGRSEAQLQLTP